MMVKTMMPNAMRRTAHNQLDADSTPPLDTMHAPAVGGLPAPFRQWGSMFFCAMLVLTALTTAMATATVAQAQERATGAQIEAAIEQAFIAGGRKIAPSVVMIEVERSADEPSGADPRFRMHSENPAYRQRPPGPVSGVIVGADGFIITTNFNVSGTVTKIAVTLGDGRQFLGRLLGRNEVHDLALVKIEATNLPTPEARDTSANIRPGEFCAVVGRSEDPLIHTMTTGVVSAVGRQAMGAIQFDAQTNYGNTGGAIVDLRGRLIGIAHSIRPNVPHGLNSGVCFGMPWHVVAQDLPDLRLGRVVTRPRVPFLGIKPDQDAIGVNGVRVAEVIQATGAAAARIQPGDVIVKCDGTRIRSVTDLRQFLQDKRIGDRITLTFVRDRRERTAVVILGERP